MTINEKKSCLNSFFIEKAQKFSRRYPSSRTSVFIEFRGSRKKATETLSKVGFKKRFDLYSSKAMIGTVEFKSENVKFLESLLKKGELKEISPLGILEDL